MLKRHDDFLTSLDVNQDKVEQIIKQSERLTQEGNYASDRIYRKAENIMERFNANRDRANSIGQKLRDARQLQQYLRDVEEHLEFINNKRIQVVFCGLKNICCFKNKRNCLCFPVFQLDKKFFFRSSDFVVIC